ncbi:hypothetical protein DSO57_1027084 [Entomophthora muscae]|uniref:Uncharacterized protein n=1 Tax=Entomophthora muscae TaxID=34485 RepID=A0ACC2T1Z5_9FUNG|nr:hypothetical protein DSO57_1027084 [Entomophthora muscae]
MFCPPLDPRTIERVYTKSANLEVAISDLLLIAEEVDLNTRASSPEIPFTDSSESTSSQGTDKSAIEFLGVCFPGASSKYLQEVYDNCNEEVEKAIDFILSEEFILQEGFNTEIEKEPASGCNTTPSSSSSSSSKASQGKRPKKKGKKGTGGKESTRDLYSCQLDWSNIERWQSQHWAALEQRFEYILEMLPKLGRLPVVLALRKANGDLYQAIDSLMNSDGRSPEAPSVEAEVRKLREVFPQHSMVKLTVYALQWPGVDDAINRLVGENLPAVEKLKLEPPELWTVVAKKPAPSNHSLPTTYSLPANPYTPDEFKYEIPNTGDYNKMRKQVALLKEARQRAFHQAAQAYRQRHTCGQSAAAAFYSSEGREISSRIAKLHASTAQAFAQSSSSKYQIDLHGLTVAEAAPLVAESVDAWYARETTGIQSGRLKKLTPFVIITGAGKHSTNGVSRMKPMVTSLLKRHGWKHEVKSASIEVLGPK